MSTLQGSIIEIVKTVTDSMSDIDYLYRGQLRRDIQQVLANQAEILTLLNAGTAKDTTMQQNLETILQNEQAEATAISTETTAINELAAGLAQTNKDLAAAIANLQAQGVDTTDLQTILTTQQANLAAQQSNLTAVQAATAAELAVDPVNPPIATPGTTTNPPVAPSTVSTETVHRGTPVDPINPAAV